MAVDQRSFMWYELMTTDVAEAKSFYAHVVGWNSADMPMPDQTYTLLQTGDVGVAGIMEMPAHMKAGGATSHWVGYIHARDVDASTQDVQRLGGQIKRAPADIPGVGRFSVVADPQGAIFHLMTPNGTGERTVSDVPGQPGWHELHTSDWPHAFDFYSGMFGWEKGRAVDMGPMGVYQLFTVKGRDTGGMMNSPAAAARCFWLYYFNVEDIDAGGRRIDERGGRIMSGPHTVPDGSWIIQATDPHGAWFAIRGWRR